jgi:nucleoside phosphorylase
MQNKYAIVTGATSGIGKVNAAITTTLLITEYKPDFIFSSCFIVSRVCCHTLR